jgi:rsbT co-antagonist protein RsbR
MPPRSGHTLRNVLNQHEKEIHAEWVEHQLAAATLRSDLMREAQLREQSREFLSLFQAAVQSGEVERVDGPSWKPMQEFLAAVSRSRAQQGFSPS